MDFVFWLFFRGIKNTSFEGFVLFTIREITHTTEITALEKYERRDENLAT